MYHLMSWIISHKISISQWEQYLKKEKKKEMKRMELKFCLRRPKEVEVSEQRRQEEGRFIQETESLRDKREQRK